MTEGKENISLTYRIPPELHRELKIRFATTGETFQSLLDRGMKLALADKVKPVPKDLQELIAGLIEMYHTHQKNPPHGSVLFGIVEMTIREYRKHLR